MISINRFLLLAICLLTYITTAQELNSPKRDSLFSSVLNEDRALSIYLPPSYYTTNEKFPVLYILDGDYNFMYVSGLIELQSSISNTIPELIVVAISGKGTKQYRKDCKPNVKGAKDAGTADMTLGFIQDELLPYINKNYRVSDYKILGGHSIGGLFVTYAALTKPTLFNNYIAISPALWWEKNAINKIAKETIKKNSDYQTNAYMSLANEKGMGVADFLKHVSDKHFKFKQFPDENHNSVGSPTYVWALKDIFKTWKGEEEFYTSADDYKAHLLKTKAFYGSHFNASNELLGYTIYKLKDNPNELKKLQTIFKEYQPSAVAQFNNLWANRLLKQEKTKEAEALLNTTKKDYPNVYDTYNTLAKIALEKKDTTLAKQLIEKAFTLAKQQKLRQWQLNELLEVKGEIEK